MDRPAKPSMDPDHLRRHLEALRARVAFLRPLRPENPSYKLWLGDIIELVTTVWGVSSPQMAPIVALLQPAAVSAIAACAGGAEHSYRARLDGLDAILAGYEREIEER